MCLILLSMLNKTTALINGSFAQRQLFQIILLYIRAFSWISLESLDCLSIVHAVGPYIPVTFEFCVFCTTLLYSLLSLFITHYNVQ